MGKEEGGRECVEEEELPFIPFTRPPRVRSGRGQEQVVSELTLDGHITAWDPAREGIKGQCRAWRCISKGLSREGPPIFKACCRRVKPWSKQEHEQPSMTSLALPAAGIPPEEGKSFGEKGWRLLVRLGCSITQALASGSRGSSVQWQVGGGRGYEDQVWIWSEEAFAELHVG